MSDPEKDAALIARKLAPSSVLFLSKNFGALAKALDAQGVRVTERGDTSSADFDLGIWSVPDSDCTSSQSALALKDVASRVNLSD